MTSNQQRLEELRQQAKNLAQQIEQLEDPAQQHATHHRATRPMGNPPGIWRRSYR